MLLELNEQVVEPFGLAFEHICELQDLSLEQLREHSIAMNVIVMATRATITSTACSKAEASSHAGTFA